MKIITPITTYPIEFENEEREILRNTNEIILNLIRTMQQSKVDELYWRDYDEEGNLSLQEIKDIYTNIDYILNAEYCM